MHGSANDRSRSSVDFDRAAVGGTVKQGLLRSWPPHRREGEEDASGLRFLRAQSFAAFHPQKIPRDFEGGRNLCSNLLNISGMVFLFPEGW